MANAWCLLPEHVDRFKKGLKDREIDPVKLAALDSVARRDFFESFVGKENAQEVNALFESKLLLKNQKAGFISWAKKVSGLTPQAKRDIVTKIQKLDQVLSPKEGQQFLEDLASKKLGIGVTEEEAKAISDLSQKVTQLKTKIGANSAFPSEADRLAYGRARVELTSYVNDLKNVELKGIVQKVSNLAGSTKAIRASFDDSAIFRQGWRTIWTHPKTWSTNAVKSIENLVKSFGKDNVMKELNADLVSRPNFLNDNYKAMRLALGNLEEDFPTTIPEKIPVLGKIYKASENAFTAFIQKTRADIADKYIDIAQKSGVDLTKKELESIGKLVNSLTGRGSLGRAEPAADIINNVFFSPRNLKSHIDFLTLHASDPNFSGFARKQAAYNLVKVILGSGAVLAIAKAINPDSVETNPQSSDFGKIKVGSTRFDVTGGMASLITLVDRLVTGASKSTETGAITPVSTAYGGKTRLNYVTDFFSNKLSPVASVVKELLNQKDFNGNTPTIAGELKNLFLPLPIANFEELQKDPNSANIILATLADALGIATNTYSPTKDWQNSTSKEMTQFRQKIGEDEFKKASDSFNQQYNALLKNTINTDSYKKLSDEEKKGLIQDGVAKIKQSVLDSYKFKYERATPAKKSSALPSKDVLSSLADSAGKFISNITPSAKAEDPSKNIKNIKVDGNTVITTYSDGNIQYKDINFDLSVGEQIGKVFNDVGKSLGLPELHLSESLGYKSEKDRIAELLKYNDMINKNLKNAVANKNLPVVKIIPEVKAAEIQAPTPSGDTSETKPRNPSFKQFNPTANVVSAIDKAGQEYGVPPSFLKDVAMQESSLNAEKINDTQAGIDAGNPTGLFQFTDGTWQTILDQYNNKPGMSLHLNSTNRQDPLANAQAAAYLIKHGQLDKWADSEGVWGNFWTPTELEKLGFYDQSPTHIKGHRWSVDHPPKK